MKQLVKIGGLLSGMMMLSTLSHGAGTSAGVSIENQASVTYQTASGGVTNDSAIVAFTVQELIRSTLVKLDASSVSVSSPQTEAAMKFRLQNDGNGDEGFVINVSQDSGDDFDVTVGSYYIDDGDGVLNTALDTLYDNNNPPVLAPDASLVLWVTADIPGSLSDADLANLNVSAVSRTFVADGQTDPAAGAVVNGAGSSSPTTDAVNAEAITSVTSSFVVTDIDVAISKAISATRDNLGGGAGNQAVPGAEVDYILTVTVTGTGTANDVEVTDDLPIQLQLKDGTSSGVITVGGVDRTASGADSDGASYDANTGLITVELGNINAGDPSIDIEFTTVIQ
ncbi:hypothetical protein NBRC116188_16690 [Oceaniserpentilla sp. 4NH20-0058]|uniref:hypothetical protein n=1 Tax=Oceaniserpentilla sp. 4NH20-0058 TaxID=3127660 RepID=UPI003101E474